MDRTDILKRMLYPKCKTATEFKFDSMTVNPLLSYVSIDDINKLNKIATSNKLASKPKEKYAMINDILVPRGFKKLASGTNRVAYRHLNDYRVVLKVAIDRVGLSDNGNEYRVQHLLKPFVTKCFEVSPCGTVGLFERVTPITSREEFTNVSEDIFDLINNLIGKFVLDDIGEKYFLNYGLREGFGPVLLDYPYAFELDGRKLICNVREPSGEYCRGEIDYDIGYNDLICTKCGKRYLATELKSSSENSDDAKIIIKGEDCNMKVVLKRGNEVVSYLNSKEQDSTKVIKPKKDFSNLKCRVVIPDGTNSNKDEEEISRSIVDRDEINMKVVLRGYPTNKNKSVDENAWRKEDLNKRKVKSIPVSFKDDLFEENSDDINMKVVIKTPEAYSPLHVINNTVEKEDVIETVENPIIVEDKNTDDNRNTTVRILENGEIWDTESNTLIGYTLEAMNSMNGEKSEDDINDDVNHTIVDYYSDRRLDEKPSTETFAGGYRTNYIKGEIANMFSNPEEVKDKDICNHKKNEVDQVVRTEDVYKTEVSERSEIHERKENDQVVRTEDVYKTEVSERSEIPELVIKDRIKLSNNNVHDDKSSVLTKEELELY